MRAFDNGTFFTVLATEQDVRDFARRWPCFGDVRSLWFQFQKSSGDLVDTNHRAEEVNDERGISALADDCKTYGIRQLKLRSLEP